MADIDLGTDVSTYTLNDEGVADLDPFFEEIDGDQVLGEQILRRWETPRGGLFYDKTIGGGLREMLSARLSTSRVLEKRSLLTTQAERDERVYGAEVEIEAVSDTTLVVSGDVTVADGRTFELVASINDVTIELLSPQ